VHYKQLIWSHRSPGLHATFRPHRVIPVGAPELLWLARFRHPGGFVPNRVAATSRMQSVCGLIVPISGSEYTSVKRRSRFQILPAHRQPSGGWKKSSLF